MDSSEHEPLAPNDRATLSDEARRAEQLLKRLQPRPVNLDRERLMFLAGIAAAGGGQATTEIPQKWLWPATTLAMSSVAACLAIALTVQLSLRAPEQVVVREIPAPQPIPAPRTPESTNPATAQPQPATGPRFVSAPVLALPAGSALQMRNMALQFGIDAIPTSSGLSSTASESPRTPNRWQQLRGAAEPTDPSL